MNEIPTTEQVRHGYSIVDGGLNDPWIRGDAEKRFDRWLAEVKAEAWDEGWCRCFDSDGYKTDNPYRRGETE